jgi:hypothetical protein
MSKFVPPVLIPAKEIENCSECPFFHMYPGWDGEYYCTKIRVDIKYSFALEHFHEDCPLIDLTTGDENGVGLEIE